MASATQHWHNRIAIVFDFDMTLAPDSFNALLARCGVDPEPWRRAHVSPLAASGWDVVLARAYALLGLSRSGARVTIDLMRAVGRDLEPFEGVPAMFDRLRSTAQKIEPGIAVEFYLLTSGFVDIHRGTAIAHEFKAMWGTELHFDDGGSLTFVKQTVTHPEKVRYLLQLAKGTGTGGPNAPADVYREVPDEDWHVPLDQMVYVGDGASDMPAFSLLQDRGGLALAVYKSETAQDWDGRAQMHAGRRAQNLAPADFREGGELTRSLHLAVESIAKKIALRRLSCGE